MSRPITVSVDLPATPAEVWDDVARLEHHVEWMADAHRIDFIGDQQRGTGTRMEVETRFGPLRTTDVMEVTDWVPGERMAVVHRGLFTGEGAFTLAAVDGGTRFTWTERIRFPWFFGGPVGAWFARPIFAWVWKRNLSRLRDRFTAR